MLADALRARGFAPSAAAPPVPAPAPIDEEPPPAWAIEYGANLLRVNPRRDWCAALARAATEVTREARNRFNGLIQRELDQLPVKQARDLGPLLGDWTSKGVPTWSDMAQDVIGALAGGYSTRLVEDVAATPAVPVLGMDEDEASFVARAEAWAEKLTRAQLRAATGLDDPTSWARDVYWVVTATRAREAEEAARAREAAKWGAIAKEDPVRAILDGREHLAPKDRETATSACIPLVMSALDDGANIVEMFDAWEHVEPVRLAIRSHARTWAEAGEVAPAGTPPQGWEGLSEAQLLRVWPTAEAVAELTRRHQPGELVRSEWLPYGNPHVLTDDGWHPADKNLPSSVTKIALLPHRDGWLASPTYTRGPRQYCGPPVFNALNRAAQRAGGCCDVSRVMKIYGRAKDRNFPRLSTSAWKTWITVGISDALGQAFDDIALLLSACPNRVTPEMLRIDAQVRRTQSGGLQIVPSQGESTAILLIEGGTSSHGRHGVSGTMRRIADENKAFSISAEGYSNGGGQRRTVVIAAITEDRPLLLASGEGYILTPEGVFKVPGLAEGCPGDPVPA